MPDDLGNDVRLINEGGEITGQGAGDGPVQIADFTNDPPEVIEGRTPQQQAADAQQAAQEAQRIAQEGSISAITPEEELAAQQKDQANREEAYRAFDEGYVPGPNPTNGMDTIYYQEWQRLVEEGKRTVPVVEEAHNPQDHQVAE